METDLELEELVVKEATKLKRFAEVEELQKLDYNTLNAEDAQYCIYGQMTGHCESKRANFLIMNCAERVYKPGDPFNRISTSTLNGKPHELNTDCSRMNHYFSPIEVFLVRELPCLNYDSEKVRKLMDFLSDKTKELKF